MNKKSIISLFTTVLLFSVFFGYTLAYAGTGFFNNTLNVIFKTSNNIFLDSIYLNKNKILFKSSYDLSKYKIKSSCDIFSKMKLNKGDYYLFEIKFFNNECSDNNLILVDENGKKVKTIKINIIKEYDILSNLLDIKTDKLLKIKDILQKKVNSYLKYEKYNSEIEKNYYKYLQKNRLLREYRYNLNIVNNIIEKRSKKYIVPLLGHKLPTKSSKIPNSGRPYRSSYTDGIHHGWDIDGNFGEQVLAIDEGIIVRVVSDFKFEDLNKIKRGGNVSYLDKVKNLDILRGNQVWLKTMKGDVIFYSHLNNIFTDIKEGTIVRKGQPLGTIGISGVPDKNYSDFHIHFPIQVNPFNNKKIGKYTIDDYLNWDWLFKGQTSQYVLDNQNNIFEN